MDKQQTTQDEPEDGGAWGGFIAAGTGLVLATLSLTGTATDYVRPVFVPLIMLAGVGLLVFGVWTMGVSTTSGKPRASAWAVVAVAVLAVVAAPGPLGSYFVDSGRTATVQAASAPTERPEGETRLDTLAAAYDAGLADGARVTMEGFAGSGQEGTLSQGRWFLARYKITCCVADATGVRIALLGATPEQSQWYRATGQVTTDDYGEMALEVSELTLIDEPEVPYL